MERRKFIGIGGGVIAGAAVGAVGSRYGSGMATGGQLVAMAQSRGLSGDEARGALQTVVPDHAMVDGQRGAHGIFQAF